MMVKHISIEVTSKQTKKPVEDRVLDYSAYEHIISSLKK